MKRRSNVFSFLVLIILLFIGGAVLYIKSQKFALDVKEVLCRKLSNYTTYPVEIKKIRTDIFNQFIISKVKVKNPVTSQELLTVEKMTVKYSLLKFFVESRDISSLVREINIYHPQVTVHYTTSSVNVKGIKGTISGSSDDSFSSVLPPWKFNVFDGEINVQNRSRTINRIKDLNGSFSLGGYPEIYVDSSFELEGISENIGVKGNVHTINKELLMKVEGKGINLNKIGEISFGEKKYEFESGLCNVDLKIDGNMYDIFKQPEELNVNGDIKILKASSGSFGIPVARLNLSSQRVRIESGVVRWGRNIINVTGMVRDYIKTPYLDINGEGSISSEEIFKNTDIKDIRGIFDVKGSVKGPIGNVTAQADLYMKSGEVFNIKADELKTNVKYKNKNIKFGAGSVELADGKLMWEGDWMPKGAINVSMSADGISLSKISGQEKIEGNLDGNLGVKGETESPYVTADITAEDVVIAGRRFEHINIKGNFENDRASIDGFTLDGKYSFEGIIDIEKENKLAKINKFNISGLEKGVVSLNGKLEYPGLTGNLDFNAKNIELSELPWVKKIYPQSSGQFNMNGIINKINSDLNIKGELDTRNFNIKNRKIDIYSDINFSFNQQESNLVFNNLKINKNLTGNFELIKTGKNYTISKSSINAYGADIKDILVFIGKEFHVQEGTVEGNFEYLPEKGRGRFAVKDLYIRDIYNDRVEFEVTYSSQIWKVKSMNIEKDDGLINLQGDIYPGQDLEVSFRKYNLKGRTITAQGKYRGGADSSGKKNKYTFNSNFKEIKFGDHYWPDINLKGNRKEKDLYVNIDIGENINGQFHSYEKDFRNLEGDFWVNKLDVEKIYTLLNIDINSDVKGKAKGNLKVLGTAQNPMIIFQGSLENGMYKNAPITAESEVEYNNGKTIIKRVEGNIGSQGYYNITGKIDKENNINSSVEVKNFDLKIASDDLKILKNLKGRADFKAEVTGKLSDPQISVDLSAENTEFNQLKFNKITGKFSYKSKNVFLNRLIVNHKQGLIEVKDGGVDVSSLKEIGIGSTVEFKNFNFGPFSLFGDMDLKGIINTEPFGVKIEGKPVNFIVNRLDVKKEFIFNYSDKNLVIDFKDGLKGIINIENSSNFNIQSIRMNKEDKEFFCKGLYGSKGIDISLSGSNIQINKITRLFDRNIDCYGISDFNTQIKGDFQNLYSRGYIKVKQGSFNNVKIMETSADFVYHDKNLEIKNGYIKEPNSIDLIVSGIVGKESNLKVKVNRISLSVLKHISSEITKAGGFFQGGFTLKGPLKSPLINGKLDLEQGKIYGNKIIDKITSINCKITAQGNKLSINSLTADWEPGSIEGNGYIDLATRPVDINLLFKTVGDKGVSVKVPYLDIPQSNIFRRYLTLPSNGEPKGTVSITTQKDNYLVKGDVTLTNTNFTYPPAKSSQRPSGSTILDDVAIDIDLKAGESVWYENTYARVKLSGMLNFKKYPDKEIIINGEVHSSEGTVSYFNRDFSVNQASMEFEETVEYISAAATTDIHRKTGEEQWDEDVIEMVVPRSRVADIKPEFSSTRFAQETSSREALELAIAGVEFEDLNQAERNALLRKELLRTIDANLTSPLVQSILKKTELVDTAKIDMKVKTQGEDQPLMLEGAGLSLGRYFTDRLYMGYYMEVGGVENKLRLSHELDVFYRLQGSQFLRGRISGDERFLGLEQQIRF